MNIAQILLLQTGFFLYKYGDVPLERIFMSWHYDFRYNLQKTVLDDLVANKYIMYDVMSKKYYFLIRVYSMLIAKDKLINWQWDFDQMQNEEWDVQVQGFRIHVAARRWLSQVW